VESQSDLPKKLGLFIISQPQNYFFFGEACGVFLGACLDAEDLPLDCVCPITYMF